MRRKPTTTNPIFAFRAYTSESDTFRIPATSFAVRRVGTTLAASSPT
jgi:hypothetical protein